MEALPEFQLIRPTTLDELIGARAAHPQARLLGGGTDLLVNIRRGIEAPPVLIETTNVRELRALAVDAHALQIGASITLSELAGQPEIRKFYPVVAQAAGVIAGPTQRNMVRWAGIFASIPGASITIRANGGARPIIIASRPPERCAMWHPRAAACALPPSAATWRRRC